MIKLSPEVIKYKDELISVRRHIHQNPELGFEEHETMKFIVEKLKSFGLRPQYPIAKTGLSCTVVGDLDGPAVMIRADMDALPIHEGNPGIDYRSLNEGKMHACGHDGHTAIALITAKILYEKRATLKGRVKFVFQPAEEGEGGARPMIEEGVLNDPPIDVFFGLHLANSLNAGEIGVRGGPVMASTDEFVFTVDSSGGHAAYPHTAVDPIVVTSQIILALQTIVSRTIDPIEPVVITVGSIHGGKAFNVIPTRVECKGTIRSFRPEVRDLTIEKMKMVIEDTASAMGAKAQFTLIPCYPSTINHDGVAEFSRLVGHTVFGEKGTVKMNPSMGGEDVSYFLQKVPGCFFFLGSANKEKGLMSPLHSANFNFDEDVLAYGVQYFLSLIERYFEEMPVF